MINRPEKSDSEVIQMIQLCIDSEMECPQLLFEIDEDVEICRKLFSSSSSPSDTDPTNDTDPASPPRPLENEAFLPSRSPKDSGEFFESETLPKWKGSQFDLVRLLGAGSFGIVFAVRESATGRSYAMKLLRPSLIASTGLRRRFFRETLAVRELSCEGIVKPYGVGYVESIPAILEELVDGPSLRGFLENSGGCIPEKEAISIVAQVANYLHYMHERGILHRDLKPANILLKPVELESSSPYPYRPMIADFGLARQVDAETFTNLTGATGELIIGTLRYMAPEQAEGNRDEISTLSDLYSLAVVLHECLVGSGPNHGTTYIEILNSMRRPIPRSIRKFDKKLSEDVDLVLQRALAHRPRDRYASVAEFGADLENILRGEPVNARKRSTLAIWSSWAKHNPVTAALWTSLLSVLLISSFGLGVLYYREKLAVARFKELMETTQECVRVHVDVAEDILTNVPASAEHRYQLHRSALAALESISDGIEGDIDNLHRISVQYSYLASAASQSLRHGEGIQLRRACLRIIDKLLQRDPNNLTYLYDQFYNQKSLSDSLCDHETSLDKCLELQSKNLPLIRHIRSLAPENSDYLDAEAAVLHAVGELQLRGRIEGARDNLIQAVEISNSLIQKNPTKLLHAKYAVTGRALLGDLARLEGDLDRALDVCEEGIRFVETLEHPGKGDYWFLYVMRELRRSHAATLIASQRWEEAIPALQSCIEIEELIATYDPKRMNYVVVKAGYLGEQVRALRKLGISQEEVSSKVAEIEKLIEIWKSMESSQSDLARIQVLLSNPDAPPLEPGLREDHPLKNHSEGG